MSNGIKRTCGKCGKSFTNNGGYIQHVKECKGRPKEVKSTFDNKIDIYKAIRDVVVDIHLGFRVHKLYPIDTGFIKFKVEKIKIAGTEYVGVFCDYRPDATMIFIVQTILQKCSTIPCDQVYFTDRVYGKIFCNKQQKYGIKCWWQTPCAESEGELLEYWEMMRKLMRDYYELPGDAKKKLLEESEKVIKESLDKIKPQE